MNGFEEIQKIVKNFIYESKQIKQQIAEIERERTELAQDRNRKKKADINIYGAYINVLGKQISELGNQSQELQNKLDSRFNEVKSLVNLTINNLITEGIRKIRKIDEEKQELETRISLQEERTAKYEMQKQEFYERFGRVPELSENAKKESEIQDKQCLLYKSRIEELEDLINDAELELVELVGIKRDFKNRNWSNIVECEEKEKVVEKIEEVEEETTILPLVEEIQIEEFEPIEEVRIEEFGPIEEIEIEELTIEAFEDVVFKEETNTISENIVEEQKPIDEIEEIARMIVEQIAEEQTRDLNINEIEKTEEQEIITFEEKEQEEKNEVPVLEENITLSSIIAKIEDGEIVYKAQVSNGEEIKVCPKKLRIGNAFLKEKEIREGIKEFLINYAVAEHKILDKKVMKKIDPIVCEVLEIFAKKFDYDEENLIYNYAMSFSRNRDIEIDIAIPITYNFSYINSTNLSKTEKRTISKICKNATENGKIDIIGNIGGFNKIRYIFKRLFASNSVKSLPEGKY